MTGNIYLAFRFHGNFYHSYRGDTPDELGFGKDIRIIRHILQTLDELNAEGIPVCGTWDFENYFSFEKIIPAHSPDIITNLQRRVREGHDDIQLMSYNNGLVSAHTAREFEENIRRSLTNAQGSGVNDLFDSNFQGMVRPQEMMYTPIHLKLYPAYGVNSISLFYSALPFNGFSNFIPQLSFTEQYNPLTLTYPGISETMTLVPCYSTGDLADHLTLRRWVKQIRAEQLKLDQPTDLLLTIDMDADDEFWVGYKVPILDKLISSLKGLTGLVKSVADLNYLVFTTPDRYLKGHPPVGTVTIAQDTADGSFDGYSSWAEKWSNQRLWTGVERSRILALQTKRLLGDNLPADVQSLLNESFDSRLKSLSTTHFGMAAPVMNCQREKVAADIIENAVNKAYSAFEKAQTPSPASFSLIDYIRGESTQQVQFTGKASKALIRLPLKENAPQTLSLLNTDGTEIPAAVIQTNGSREILFVDSFSPEAQKDYQIVEGQEPPPPQAPVSVTESALKNETLTIEFNANNQVDAILFNGTLISTQVALDSQITYNGQNLRVENWQQTESTAYGIIGLKRFSGSLKINQTQEVKFEREILLAAGLPYLYISMKIFYPLTEYKKYNAGQAERLGQPFDNRWEEVIPCQISPNMPGTSDSPLRVWKHNYCNHISSFSLDYSTFSPNDELDSVNNHVTDAWVAVSNGKAGLLVAQNADVNTSMAFCPLRTRKTGSTSSVRLNPFGSYWGKQYHYQTADTGFGKFVSVSMSAAAHISPYAPSFNGRMQEFSMMIAPYAGDAPPESIQSDAEAFAYPYILLHDQTTLDPPPHLSWDTEGLGIPPTEA